MKKLFPDYEVFNRYKTAFGKEIDVYIPALRLGLEPGSWILHKLNVDRDENKISECAEHDIRIVTVYEGFKGEEKKPFDKDCYVIEKNLTQAKNYLLIRDVLKDVFKDYEFDEEVWSDYTWENIALEARGLVAPLAADPERSLANVAPKLAKEWSPNNKMSPDQVYAKSNVPALWICSHGHEFTMAPSDRMEGSNCNICAGRVADPRYNTVKKLYPDFLQYLSPENKVDPDSLTPSTRKEVLTWTCPECGKDFEMTPYRMFNNCSTICPKCHKHTFPHTPFRELDF